MPGSYISTRWYKRLCLTLDHSDIMQAKFHAAYVQANFYNCITLYYTLEHMYIRQYYGP